MDTCRVRVTLSLVAMILVLGSAWLAAMPGAEAVRDAPAAASAKVLEGHVYEIVPGFPDVPLGGVTVSLYGTDSHAEMGTLLTSTTTNSEGWYGLTVSGRFNYYNIIETDPPDYISAMATSIGGMVMNSNWIRYTYAGLNGTLTDNNFWDRRRAPTLTPTHTPAPTGTPIHLYLPIIIKEPIR